MFCIKPIDCADRKVYAYLLATNASEVADRLTHFNVDLVQVPNCAFAIPQSYIDVHKSSYGVTYMALRATISDTVGTCREWKRR